MLSPALEHGLSMFLLMVWGCFLMVWGGCEGLCMRSLWKEFDSFGCQSGALIRMIFVDILRTIQLVGVFGDLSG